MIYDPQVVVEQFWDGVAEAHRFRVIKLVATTQPLIHTILTENEVKELIDPVGVKVTIVPQKVR